MKFILKEIQAKIYPPHPTMNLKSCSGSLLPWKCPSNMEYFVFGIRYLNQASVSKLSSEKYQDSVFKKHFYTDINVGRRVKIPRFRSLSEAG